MRVQLWLHHARLAECGIYLHIVNPQMFLCIIDTADVWYHVNHSITATSSRTITSSWAWLANAYHVWWWSAMISLSLCSWTMTCSRNLWMCVKRKDYRQGLDRYDPRDANIYFTVVANYANVHPNCWWIRFICHIINLPRHVHSKRCNLSLNNLCCMLR